MKPYLKMILLSLVVVFSVACGSESSDQGDDGGANTNISGEVDEITLDGFANDDDEDLNLSVVIPLEIFGDSAEAVDGVLIDVLINESELFSDIVSEDFYHSDVEQVRFVVSPVLDGSSIQVVFTWTDGTTSTFSGTVSFENSTFATEDQVVVE